MIRRTPYLQSKPPPGAQVDRAHPLSRGLAVWWLFNEGAGSRVADIVARKHGELTNGPVWTGGKFGRALRFNGSTQYVNCGTGAELNPLAITMAVWVLAGSFPAAYQAPISRASGTSFNQILVKSTGKLAPYVYATNTVSYDGTGNTALVANQWYHLAVTYDSVSGLQGYVNGVLDGSALADGNLRQTANIVTALGTDLQTAGRYWTGNLGNARVYSRALSAEEVRKLYATPFANLLAPRRLVPVGAAAGWGPLLGGERNQLVVA